MYFRIRLLSYIHSKNPVGILNKIILIKLILTPMGFPGGSYSKASAYNVGDSDSMPGSVRSSGEGNGNPLQYSCLENPMDGGTW